MKINGLNGINTQTGGINMMQSNDSVSKNIQNQIANAQKQLQELSANKEMSNCRISRKHSFHTRL